MPEDITQPAAQAQPSEPSSKAALSSRLARYALLCALCPILPPLVDDLALAWLQRRFVRGLALEAGVALQDSQVAALTREGKRSFLGCLVGGLLYPIKKIFKKVFFFLAIKEAVDVGSLVFHRGHLLQLAAREGLLAQAAQDPARLEALRAAMDAACAAVDTRPFNRALGSVLEQSRARLFEIAGRVGGQVSKAQEAGPQAVEQALQDAEGRENDALQPLVGALQAQVQDQGYFARLEAEFRKRLAP
jgi:hypothetical protein